MRDEVDELVEHWTRAGLPADAVTRLALSKRISRLAVRHEQAMKAELADLGLTYAEFDVLAALYRADGPLRPSDLSRALFLTSGGTSNVLQRLTAAGHVAGEPNGGDGRGRLIRLTAPGRALTEQAMTASTRLHEDLYANVPTATLQAAADALRPVVSGTERRRV
ncbi:MarR family transcriptional regulator [Nocardia sp. NPDC005978]|uniref:MarR family winged helix-turn-helix transcriptional regulator n=1 Tax=Nocardia sp. NPDC005978 TaxID=3156725 RepID=UPI0033A6AA01